MRNPNEARDRQIVRRRISGESYAAIARDLGMREERVRRVFNKHAPPGATCTPPGVTLAEVGGIWIADGLGSRATGRTADIAVSRWHSAQAQRQRAAAYRAEQARRKAAEQQEAASAMARVVPPRQPRPFVPLRLSQAFRAAAERAGQFQKPIINMGSRVPEGGVL